MIPRIGVVMKREYILKTVLHLKSRPLNSINRPSLMLFGYQYQLVSLVSLCSRDKKTVTEKVSNCL